MELELGQSHMVPAEYLWTPICMTKQENYLV